MKYTAITKDGETLLREVNPIDQRFALPGCADVCMNREESIEFEHFEQSAIANAKFLINPVSGKVEYSSEELRDITQIYGYGIWFKVLFPNKWKDHQSRQAFEYIGEKVEENEHLETDMKKASDMYSQGVFSLLNPNNPARNRITESATIDFEAGWESGEQAERSRIIGLIESVMKKADMIGYLTLNELLTLMKQDGK